jgi:hypothetical protein
MSDSTFWIIFWILVLGYFSFDSYMTHKTKVIESETKLKIEKMKKDRDDAFRKSMENIVKSVKETL